MKMLVNICLIPILVGCAVQVKTLQKPNVDFNSFTSWCWMQGCEVVYQGPDYYYDERVVNEISNAIAWNMHNKGYLQGDERSDLLLNFYIIMQKDSAEISDVYKMMFTGEREWLNLSYPEYHQFLKGSLIIDILDRKSSELIWTSKAVKYLEINPAFDKESIWKGVSKAMRKFPRKEK